MRKLITALLLLITNLMLGLKSNYLLVAAITIGYSFISSKKRKPQLSKLFVVLSIIAGIMVITRVFANEIDLIISRWDYFYNSRDFMSFWTSARWDRVEPALEWLKNQYGLVGVIFGSGLEYTYHTVHTVIGYSNIIEMDLLDIFFQMGLFGVVVTYGFYFRIIRKYEFKHFYKIAFWESIVIGTLAGHVMESALSGMFFSFVCSAGIVNYRERKLNL